MQTWQPPSPSVTIVPPIVAAPNAFDLDSSAGKAWHVKFSQGLNAAQNSAVGLENSNASGLNVYVDYLWITASGATDIQMAIQNGNPIIPTIGNAQEMAADLANLPRSMGANNVFLSNGLGLRLPIAAGGLLAIPLTRPFVITPNHQLVIVTIANNITLGGGALGRTY